MIYNGIVLGIERNVLKQQGALFAKLHTKPEVQGSHDIYKVNQSDKYIIYYNCQPPSISLPFRLPAKYEFHGT